MDYKKAIEELENHKQNISVRDCELLDAIDFAIGVMEEVEKAQNEMPEKNCYGKFHGVFDDNYFIDGYNQSINKCTIIHAKKMIEMYSEISGYKDMVGKKNAEIAELKDKLKKYEGDTTIVGGKEVPIVLCNKKYEGGE